MSKSRAEIANIEAIEVLSRKFIELLNPVDVGQFMNALADTAAVIIHDASDPETVRNQFVAALDQSLDMLTYMPPDMVGL